MKEEFNLKDKGILDKEVPRVYYPEEDVKEFIKKGKEIIRNFFPFDKLNRFILYPEELEDLIQRLNELSGFEEEKN